MNDTMHGACPLPEGKKVIEEKLAELKAAGKAIPDHGQRPQPPKPHTPAPAPRKSTGETTVEKQDRARKSGVVASAAARRKAKTREEGEAA